MSRKPDPFTEASANEAYLTIAVANAELTRFGMGCDVADLVVTDEIAAAREVAERYKDQTALVEQMHGELEKAKAARKQAIADIADSAEDGMG